MALLVNGESFHLSLVSCLALLLKDFVPLVCPLSFQSISLFMLDYSYQHTKYSSIILDQKKLY